MTEREKRGWKWFWSGEDSPTMLRAVLGGLAGVAWTLSRGVHVDQPLKLFVLCAICMVGGAFVSAFAGFIAYVVATSIALVVPPFLVLLGLLELGTENSSAFKYFLAAGITPVVCFGGLFLFHFLTGAVHGYET